MQLWASLAIIAVAVASRPIEARLWHAGRLSDRAVTLLLLTRTPMLALAACIFLGADVPLTVGLLALTALPMVLLYRFVMNFIASERAERERLTLPSTKG